MVRQGHYALRLTSDGHVKVPDPVCASCRGSFVEKVLQSTANLVGP